MHVHTEKLKGALFLLLATTAWGGMFPVAKEAVQVLDPVFVTLVRYTSVALILGAFLAVFEGFGALALEGRLWPLALFGVSGMVGFNVLALYGLKTAAPAKAAMIMLTLPFLSSLVKWAIDGTRPRAGLLGCMVLAMAGVFLVVTHGDLASMLHQEAGSGELLVLLGACFWAVYTVGRERFPHWSALRYGALSTALGALGLIALWSLLLALRVLSVPSAAVVWSVDYQLIYLVAVAGVMPIMAWAAGISRIGAVNASLFICFVPITAFGVEIARGYRPHAIELVGASMAVAALFINHHLASQRTGPVAASKLSPEAK